MVVTAIEGVGVVLVDVVTTPAGGAVVEAATAELEGVVVVEVDVAARPPPHAASTTNAASSGPADLVAVIGSEV